MRIIRAILLVGSCTLLVFSLLIMRENRRLKTNNSELVAAQQEMLHAANRPILIRGFSLPIQSYSIEVAANRGAVRQSSRRLILIFSGTCRACQLQLPLWERMLNDGRFSDVETWLVSADNDHVVTDRLLGLLQHRRMQYKVLHVKSKIPFMLATGVSVTPTTLVAAMHDGEPVVEFVASGLMTSDQVGSLLDEVGKLGKTIETGTQVFTSGANTPLGME